jgi:hypothetical protein
MSTEVIVYVLTALAAVVIVLTRLRLGRESGGAGRLEMGRGMLHVHTVAGVLALALWVAFLVTGNESLGIAALGCWWIVVVAGLLILVRWLPSHGKHASEARDDSWSEGPGLSILAHVGMLVGVLVFSWAYLTSAV